MKVIIIQVILMKCTFGTSSKKSKLVHGVTLLVAHGQNGSENILSALMASSRFNYLLSLVYIMIAIMI